MESTAKPSNPSEFRKTPHKVALRIKGVWLDRARDRAADPWHKVCDLPGTVLIDPDKAYRLNLSAKDNPSYADLAHLDDRANLLALDFGGKYPQRNEQLVDEDLKPLAKITTLQSVNLQACVKVGDAGVSYLSGLRQLQSLDLHGAAITDAGLLCIEGLTSLLSLKLAHCKQVTDLGLNRLADLGRLQILDLGYCERVTARGLSLLPRFPDLQTLVLKSTQLGPSSIANLEPLTRMQWLDLSGCKAMDDRCLASLRGLKALHSLELANCPLITGAGMREFTGLSSLRKLDLRWTGVQDEHLAHLAALPQLDALKLDGCKNITNKGLAHLANLKRLKTLSLYSCYGITDAGLKNLLGLELETLDLRDTPVLPTILSHIFGCNLERLKRRVPTVLI